MGDLVRLKIDGWMGLMVDGKGRGGGEAYFRPWQLRERCSRVSRSGF